MDSYRKAAVTIVTLAAVLLVAPSALSSTLSSLPKPPAVKVKDERFGNILQSKNRLPLYYWNVEKQAGERSAALASVRVCGLLSS